MAELPEKGGRERSALDLRARVVRLTAPVIGGLLSYRPVPGARPMRVLTSCVSSFLLAGLLAQPAAAAKTVTGSAAPVATIELESEQMRLIQGGTAGKGVLHYNGQDY